MGKQSPVKMRGPVWKVGPNGTVVDSFTGAILFACGPAYRDATPAEERVAKAVACLPELIEAAEDLVRDLTPDEYSCRPSKALADRRVRAVAAALSVFRRHMPAR